MSDQEARTSILLVDDKEEKLVSLEAVLADMGLDIVRALSGREALRRLLTRDFAAILLDVNMPGMDGFETAAMIRQRKSSENTPILFITAYGDEPYVSRGYALGAVDYILTPVIPEVLRTKVGVFVELYRKANEVREQAVKLAQRADQLAGLATDLTEAEQRERRRLAQLLHDNLQQLLVAARMRLSALNPGAMGDQAQVIHQVDDLLNKSIEASRSLTIELSPPVLYDAGLVPALKWLGRQMKDHHGLTVKIHCSDEADFATENLRAFTFQAVRELLFNVVKHARVDKARVTIARGPDHTIHVSVEDDGAGFDTAILETPDSRAEHFGLFSIHERARLMQGRLNYHSVPGRGTRVTLELPDQIVTSNGDTPPASTPETEISVSQPAASRNGGKETKTRVLLADDHEILRKGLKSLLQCQPDIKVVGEAGDGPTAVNMAKRLRPDVIVMDVTLPGMNGIETTRRIKRDHPDIHIIGLSMHRKEDMASAMRAAGASVYLTKGGPPEALIAAIRRTDLSPATSPPPEEAPPASEPSPIPTSSAV